MAYSRSPLVHILHFFLYSPVFLIFWLSFFAFSCKEDPESIGIEILPGGDLILGMDTTLIVEAYTLEYDSLRSNRKRLSPVGNYSDPVFGKVSTSVLSEFGPLTYLLFSQDAEPDSLILELFFG